jgi:hypothetical protein
MGSGHHGRVARVGEGGVLLGAHGRRGRAVVDRGGQRRKGRMCMGFCRSSATRECGGPGHRRGGAGVAAAGWTGAAGDDSRSKRV